jgi:hypothetical protein
MTNHNFLVDHIGERKGAEELREGLIDYRVFVLGFNLTLESLDMLDLLGLVVASCQM